MTGIEASEEWRTDSGSDCDNGTWSLLLEPGPVGAGEFVLSGSEDAACVESERIPVVEVLDLPCREMSMVFDNAPALNDGVTVSPDASGIRFEDAAADEASTTLCDGSAALSDAALLSDCEDDRIDQIFVAEFDVIVGRRTALEFGCARRAIGGS